MIYEYWDNYKLLLNTAIKNNLYIYKNYSKKSYKYM